MSQVIWKWTVPLDGKVHEIEMPIGAVIVDGAQQGVRELCVWARCDPEAETEIRRLAWFATGQPLEDELVYHGTVHTLGGVLVWHLFELPRKAAA